MQDFKRQYKQLKSFRIESDYGNVQIDIDRSTKALSYSEDLLRMIKKHL